MREELSELIRFVMADPRLVGVDVSRVVIAPDGKKADVLVSLPLEAEPRAHAMAGLLAAKPYLRKQLADRIDLFRMPELRFVPDAELASAKSIARLVRRVRRGRPKDAGTSGPGSAE
jgi:ribosome-binding factor A